MELDGYVAALQDDLATVAALGDERTAQAAQLLAAALGPAVSRRLLEALTEASLELNDQLEGARVELRLAGNEPQLVVVHEEAAPPADEAHSARITLRLPDSLKARVEAAAAREGASVNTWIVAALSRASAEPSRGGGRRLTGFGQS